MLTIIIILYLKCIIIIIINFLTWLWTIILYESVILDR